jgi:hypothetical protein
MRFEECAEAAGLRFQMSFLPDEQGERFKINFYDHGCGVAVADADGDGRDDVFLCNQLGPCRLFRNMGGGRFDDVTVAAGDLELSLDGKICVAAAFADVDGDGNSDLYVTTTRAGNVFLKGLGGMKFRDATAEAGLALVAESEFPCFFDADGDGVLDLFVTNTARWTLDDFDKTGRYWRGKSSLEELIASEKEHDVLYRNDGSGRFTDVTDAAGLAGPGWDGDTAVFDFDDDGDLDLYVSNMFGYSTLYRNEGGGRFKDVTEAVLGKVSWGGVGARAFDYDGDGRLDLAVADMHSDMWMPFDVSPAIVEERTKYPTFMHRAKELGLYDDAAEKRFVANAGIRTDKVVFGNTLFRNLGGGKFEETSAKAGFETFWPWGVCEGDFDGDGFIDAFVPAGMGHPLFYWRSSLLRNRGDGTFEDAARSAGVDPPPGGTQLPVKIQGRACARSARSAASADFDGDGRLDFVVNNFNDRAFLWRNAGPTRRWCELRLAGKKGNREAVGALVTLTAGGRRQVRQVQAAGGYLSQSSNVLHFGLGDAGRIERVEIRWPDGTKQTLEGVKIDALTNVEQAATSR